MALHRRVTINMLSPATTMPNTTLNQEPSFTLELRFQRKFERWLGCFPGDFTLVLEEPMASPYSILVNIPPHLLFGPHYSSMIRFLDQILSSSSSSFNLENPIRDYLATKISLFLLSVAEREGSLGFNVMANVEIAHEEVLDSEEILMLISGLDGGDVVEAPTGASRSALKRLRKEGMFYGSAEAEGDCAICLEELRGKMKLIKMACDHIFHEGCLFRWLKDRNSCPMCRRPVED